MPGTTGFLKVHEEAMRMARLIVRPNRLARFITFGAALAAGSAASGQFIQKLEDFSVDPNWIGINNRSAPQDFGFSAADVTGTAVNSPGATASAGGEMGGALHREAAAVNGGQDSFYGVSIGSLDLQTQSFSVSGVVHVEQRDGGSGFYIGYGRGASSFIDDNGESGDAKNFIGIQFDDGLDGIAILWTNGGGRERNTAAGDLPVGFTVPFSMSYDPAGNGALSTTINGVSNTLNLPANAKNEVEALTTFGIMPVSAPGSFTIVWFDDLTYTTSSTPILLSTWNVNSSGAYTNHSNWTDGVPHGVNVEARFLGAIDAPQTVFADSPITLGTISFDNAHAYVLTGAGSLTMESTTAAAINVVSGSHQINLPLRLNSSTVADVSAGATLVIADPMTLVAGTTLSKTGAGTMNLIALVNSTGAATLATLGGAVNAHFDLGSNTTVNASGGTTNLHSTQHLAAVSISNDARVNLVAGANKVLVTQSLTISGSGVLDLADNDAVIDYTGSVGTLVGDVRTLLGDARIVSSAGDAARRPGYGDNAILGKSTFAGQSVDTTSLLIKFTYAGDGNLDGQVDVADLGALASAWQTSAPWTSGDFDYSGFVDVNDLGLLASNWQAGVGNPLGPAAGPVAFGEALSALGLPTTVPEPGALGFLFGTIVLLKRHRGAVS
jgi:hypothetical protein